MGIPRYQFDPGSEDEDTEYVGSWSEPEPPPIPLDLTLENLRRVLAVGANCGDATFTHQQIARWCEYYYAAFWTNDDNRRDRTADIDVAEDVFMQWDLALTNTFSLAQLQSLDFAKFRLPVEWFENWLNQLSGSSPEKNG